MNEKIQKLNENVNLVKEELKKVIIGQDDIVEKALIVILTRQHAIVEGVPGIAKTLLVKTLARILTSDFARIQFTPDLMPSDITGTNVFNMKQNEFLLVKGPVFTTFLLGDEINRAPAKTQSALLQAMQERQVTIDRETYNLNENFTVFATQNPIEYEGTYPLPEAQKDRFMMKIEMDFPKEKDELLLAQKTLIDESPEDVFKSGKVNQVLGFEDLITIRDALKTVVVKDEILSYIVNIVRKTRTHESILSGGGPRATQSLLLAARTYAAINGKDFVSPDDVKYFAIPVLGHRIVLRPEFEIEGMDSKEVINNILGNIPVPR